MILQLAQLIKENIEKNLDDRIAIAFSGGVDSSTIAKIAKENSEVELFTAGTENSQDLDYAKRIAAQLDLPLDITVLTPENSLWAYKELEKQLGLDFLKLEILVPVKLLARRAAEKGHKIMLFGSAAEELFVGYDRYYKYYEEGQDLAKILEDEFRTLPKRDIGWIKKVCLKEGIEARFPFYSKDIAQLMFSVPIEERMADKELKKGILREAAKILGTPEDAIERRKKALQYGSGVHKLLLKQLKNSS